ncbi:hypothetical protein ABIC83_002967 [Roseateles asaccharophilus]|uniref:hypothetical protein n=1 Tax=Roseateles asaccharophilus TaxID=582607 RepID=UPI0038368570
MKTRSALLASLAAFAASAAFATSYEASPADTDLKTLMERWIKEDGRRAVWEAGGNAVIKDAASMNSKLQRAKNLQEAVERLNGILIPAHNENLEKPMPIVLCVFSDVVVVRTLDESCGTQR